jgi:hypothetical protein
MLLAVALLKLDVRPVYRFPPSPPLVVTGVRRCRETLEGATSLSSRYLRLDGVASNDPVAYEKASLLSCVSMVLLPYSLIVLLSRCNRRAKIYRCSEKFVVERALQATRQL